MKTSSLLFLFFFFLSCTKIIHIDLNTSDSQLVIQAELDNLSTKHTFVKLSKTVNFSDLNVFPSVSNALVSISDDDGNTSFLTENKDSLGLYQNSSLKGFPGRTYTLKVIINNNTYTATSTMQEPVALTSILFYPNNRPNNNTKDDTTYIVGPNFNTALTNQNLFLIRLKINGQQDSTTFVRKSIQGIPNASMQPLFDSRTKIYKGDTVEVFFSPISAAVYNYFYVLNNTNGGRNTTTPSNPSSTITGGALGYFSAHPTTDYKAVVGARY